MKTIWKYVTCWDAFALMMPRGAKVLSVQVQNGVPCIWALVDPVEPVEMRRFLLVGTGHEIECTDGLSFIGTFQMRDGELVFHLFERGAGELWPPRLSGGT